MEKINKQSKFWFNYKPDPSWINEYVENKIDYRDGDIIISVPPKSGTTWTMNIVHQIRNGGDPNFKDIYIEVPWLGFLEEPGITTEELVDRINKMSYNRRRAFKTHSEIGKIPFIPVNDKEKRTVKYIVVFRNPEEALVSFKIFIENHKDEWYKKWNMSRTSYKDFSTFYKDMVVNKIFYKLLNFIKCWWPKRNEPNVLFIHFSDMKKNHEKSIKKISDFLGYKHTKEQWNNILKYTSFDWMKKNHIKFELQEIAPTALKTGGMIRKGKSGKSKEDGMTDEISADLLSRFQKELSSPTWDNALKWFYYGVSF